MPHPEISYGLTENPYNKQTVAFRAPENNCGENLKKKSIRQGSLARDKMIMSNFMLKKGHSRLFSVARQI